MRAIKKGATDQSVVIRIVDSADGTPETGVEHDSSGIDLWYRREGATKTSITEAALSALNDAHSDGGIEHIGDGYYRLDLPDAAFATGANGVMVGGTVTGMVVIGCYVPLVDFDPQDTVRLGLTALPNAAAEAAGGLYTRGSGAGQIAQDANGRVNVNVAAIETADPTDTIRDAVVDDATRIDASALNTATGTTIPAILDDTDLIDDGTSGLAKIATDVAAILVDTSTTLQGELDGIQADTEDIQTRLPAALVSGRIDASVGAMAANVMTAAAAAADLTTELQNGLATAAALSTLDGKVDTIDNFLDTEVAAILAAVDTEVAAILALLDDARTEPSQGNPPVNPDAMTKIDYLYAWARNKKENDGTQNLYYADDGATVNWKQSTAESGGTVTVGEMSTGA